jgi:hypothetical protein
MSSYWMLKVDQNLLIKDQSFREYDVAQKGPRVNETPFRITTGQSLPAQAKADRYGNKLPVRGPEHIA